MQTAMKAFYNLLVFSLLFACTVSAQADTGDSTRYLSHRDSLTLSITADGEKIIEHVIIKGQTLFSLAKFYGMNVEELYPYNPELQRTSVPIGTKVRIPIPNRAIVRFKTADFKRWKFASLHYVVQKGDNMFRIAQVHFKMPVDSLMKMNGLSTQSVSPGQKLFVGWLSTSGVSEQDRTSPTVRNNPMAKSNELKKLFGKSGKRVDMRGMAFWVKNGTQNSDLYCLHPSAPKGTVVAITNPANGRTVYAKVIGSMPLGAYPAEVKLVISPTVAKLLGAVDARFFIKYSYYQ